MGQELWVSHKRKGQGAVRRFPNVFSAALSLALLVGGYDFRAKVAGFKALKRDFPSLVHSRSDCLKVDKAAFVFSKLKGA